MQTEISNSRLVVEISYYGSMSTLRDIVVKRLEELGLGPVEAAVQGGIERSYIRDIVEGRKSSVRADKIDGLAAALRLDPAALSRNVAVPVDGDIPTDNRRTRPNASFPPRYQTFSGEGYIPLLGQSVSGPNGRFILNGAEMGRLFVPPMLEGVEGAYAVRVYGTSMEPRFKAGETVWINPHEPVRAGDDVIVQILTDEENGRESYIKEFRSRSSKVTRLWQHNPDEGEENELTFDTDSVFSVHKVVFHATV